VDDETALVQTLDFFTPIVDDPRTYGVIAAVNALSDIYAMGARPLTALNLVGFPSGTLPASVLGAMLQGGQDVLEAAGGALLGGHSIDDAEPKLGYAITGLIHPDRIWRNSTAQVGHAIYLTKPIGTGVVIKAIKDGTARAEWMEAAREAMETSNRAAADLLHQVGGPSACTDVTGFGLLGHVWEMAEGAAARFVIEAEAVPVLPGARELAAQDAFPGGSRSNQIYFSPHVHNRAGISEPLWSLCFDAVTSGGLLFTVDGGQREQLEQKAINQGIPLFCIGHVEAGTPEVVLVD
jgi:selenide,water dikinase